MTADRKRYCFMDILRLLAFVSVILYHYRSSLGAFDIFHVSPGLSSFMTKCDFQGISVCIFFMLSGAGLMLSASEEFNVKDYYVHRFFRILVPYYIAYAGYLVWIWISLGSFPFHLTSPLDLFRYIFTFAGLDTYLQFHGAVGTFSLGIGEWFFGAIIILYAVFPLIRKAILKAPFVTMTAVMSVYLLLIFLLPQDFGIVARVSVKAFNFISGAFLITCLKQEDRKCVLLFVPVFAAWLFMRLFIPENWKMMAVHIELFRSTFAVLVFYLAFLLEKYFRKTGFLKPVLIWVQRLSYEIYLIHHVLINEAFNYMKVHQIRLTVFQMHLVFAGLFIVMIAGAFVIRLIEREIRRFCLRAPAKQDSGEAS